jgi:transposase
LLPTRVGDVQASLAVEWVTLVVARARRGAKGGQQPAVDKSAHRRRTVVEHCFQRLKQFRAITTRYPKTAQSYQAVIESELTMAIVGRWVV